MKAYTLIFAVALNFITLISYAVYAMGLPFSQNILALKDLWILLGVLIASPSLTHRILNHKFETVDILIVLVIFINTLSFFMSDAQISDKVFNFRRNTAFLMVLMVFREYGIGYRGIHSFFSSLKLMLLVIFAFGIFEYSMPDSFWDDIVGISSYWASLSLDPFATSTIAENGRFYSWDLMAFFGHPVRRMVSVYFEPTTLAAFFTATFCISLACKHKMWSITIILIGSLTVSKFFVLSVPIALLVFNLSNRLRANFFMWFIIASIFISVVILFFDVQSGAFAHLKGISSLVEMVHQKKWFGMGLGAGGNYTDVSLEGSDIGAESGFGNIVAQLGIGALIYILLLNKIYVDLLSKFKKSGDVTSLAAIAALTCWSLSFFLSASSLGLSGNAFFFILIGTSLSIKNPIIRPAKIEQLFDLEPKPSPEGINSPINAQSENPIRKK